MVMFAAPDVSQEGEPANAICVMRQDGTHVAEAKVPTCPDAIADWLTERAEGLERVGMETGPLAVWLWNALVERQVPIICMNARHASGVLQMMPNDRHDARGLAQIVCTGWFKAAQIKSHDAYVNRAMLTAREALVGMAGCFGIGVTPQGAFMQPIRSRRSREVLQGFPRLLQAWMEDPDGGTKAVRDYKGRQWKPPPGVVATVTRTGAAGRPVPWRPVDLHNAPSGAAWTDVTDHAGQVVIPGKAAASITVGKVWTGVGNSAEDGRATPGVA